MRKEFVLNLKLDLEQFDRRLMASNGCDASIQDHEGECDCHQPAQFVILYDMYCEDKWSADNPIFVCGIEDHKIQHLYGNEKSPGILADSGVSNVRIVTLEAYLAEIPNRIKLN